MHRAFLPELNELAGEVQVTDDEGRHLVAACRIRVGERVEIFNGVGLAAQGLVIAIRKTECRIAIESYRKTERPQAGLILASALPKGDRLQFLIEKTTELGVERFVPLETARSIVTAREGKTDKFHRWVIEACKQCGRDWLMTIAPAMKFADFVQQAEAPAAVFHTQATISFDRDVSTKIRTVTIGPEGGWTDDEIAFCRERDVSLFRLPGHILRIETAGLAVAAIAALSAANPNALTPSNQQINR